MRRFTAGDDRPEMMATSILLAGFSLPRTCGRDAASGAA